MLLGGYFIWLWLFRQTDTVKGQSILDHKHVGSVHTYIHLLDILLSIKIKRALSVLWGLRHLSFCRVCKEDTGKVCSLHFSLYFLTSTPAVLQSF